jgi:nuclear pore complex protein Nup62
VLQQHPGDNNACRDKLPPDGNMVWSNYSSLTMYVCTYVRMYVCMYACMHVSVCMHTCFYYVCMLILCVCVCIYIYICVCVCTNRYFDERFQALTAANMKFRVFSDVAHSTYL